MCECKSQSPRESLCFSDFPRFSTQFYLRVAAGRPCPQLALAVLVSGLPVRSEAEQAVRICCVTGAWQREGSVGRGGWHGSGTIPSWLSGAVWVPTLSSAPETLSYPRACSTTNGDTSPIAIFLTGITSILQRSWRRGNLIQSYFSMSVHSALSFGLLLSFHTREQSRWARMASLSWISDGGHSSSPC